MGTKVTVDLTAVDLGHDAAPYIRECLAAGKALSRLIGSLHDVEAGTATALIPVAGMPRARQFHAGGIFPWEIQRGQGPESRKVPVMSTRMEVAATLHRALGGLAGGLCVFEYALATRGDGFLAGKPSVLICGNDVYLYAWGHDRQAIGEAMQEAVSWPGVVGVASSLPVGFGIPETHVVSEAFLREVVERALYVVVGAYDREGYLLWTPGELT
jgi:hypothetical protein